eukprot:TRINITY_DN1250_c0_g1_i1.p2 TRINITY_DN1250_c0_g1~~TRINITY_DN1250_c0_g1_i1.p2  ORF type:complete len:143 (+),score=53.59 TRINITY_DN1250_c0_g1_i1:56-430(+)
MADQGPQLSHEQAKAALTDAIAEFEKPENKARVEAALAQAEKAAEEQANGDPAAKEMIMGMQRLMVLLPLVSEIGAAGLATHGFTGSNAVMQAVAQVSQYKDADPEIAEGIAYLQGQLQGVSCK